MRVDEILRQTDAYFAAGQGREAERLLLQSIELEGRAGEREAQLQLLNELLGYYRESSQVEKSYAVAAKAIALAEEMGLQGSIPYATTLLNVANAYRAGGRLDASMECYHMVRKIYNNSLQKDSMLSASLENNLSLLYQEMGDYADAKECLLKALSIVTKKQAAFERAVTCANLANTCIQLNEKEEARSYALSAIEQFEAIGIADTHYAAAEAAEAFRRARDITEQNLGKNEYYYRLQENIAACERKMPKKQAGLALCRAYYEEYGRPMIEEQFAEYKDKIAAGLVGEGSDCFGFDDALSQDHDWGPSFCMWVTDETYAQIGERLQAAYERLPKSYKGYTFRESLKGRGRRGVMTISGFYGRLLQAKSPEEVDFSKVSDAALAAAVNGEVFCDREGIFTAFRNELKKGYTENIRYLKIAEAAARFSQTGQYNYFRMSKRGDEVCTRLMLADCMREAMRLGHYIDGVYPPHDKWLYQSCGRLSFGRPMQKILKSINEENAAETVERLAELLAGQLYEANIISDTDPWLEAHTDELFKKAVWSLESDMELVEQICALEFDAFDKVQNKGGRASCQNDWATFFIMRKSQYMTWNRTMLLQYYYDFDRELFKGHNLITEKYGRMMEFTVPGEYEQIKEFFPVLSDEKKSIVDAVVQIQVAYMEEFASEYPLLAQNARSIRSRQDNWNNTSYETYLRGEISTYSDKMLELYGRYIAGYAQGGKNPVYEIMENSVQLYGYKSLAQAEEQLREK